MVMVVILAFFMDNCQAAPQHAGRHITTRHHTFDQQKGILFRCHTLQVPQGILFCSPDRQACCSRRGRQGSSKIPGYPRLERRAGTYVEGSEN